MRFANTATDAWVVRNAGGAKSPRDKISKTSSKRHPAQSVPVTPTITEIGVPINDPNVRHIHPCVCDLQPVQRKRIVVHNKRAKQMHQKFEHRVVEIEETLARRGDERLDAEREEEKHEELYGEKYEMVGGKKKRKKRSARRVSMMSLGVKQVINWRKGGNVGFKVNKTFLLRSEHSVYCDRKPSQEPLIKVRQYNQLPKFPVRVTRTLSLRSEINSEKVKATIENEDKRPLFVTTHYYPFE